MRINRNIGNGLLVAGMVASICLVGAGTSNAQSQVGGSATFGMAARGTDVTCFSEDFGGIRNICGSRKAFVLPAWNSVDRTKHTRIWMRAKGVSGTTRTVRCQAWAVSETGSAVRFGSPASTNRHDGYAEYLWSIVRPYSRGSSQAFCRLDPGAKILNYGFQYITNY